MKKTIYVFSGLGADKRVFDRINFLNNIAIHIKWEPPIKNETIEQYSKRLQTQISEPNPILIGLSFGGLIAIEVAKIIKTEKIIIISSAKNKNEIPFYYRLIGTLYIHKITPLSLLKKANLIAYWLFGASSKHDRKILTQILNETDNNFLKWAIDKILRWENQNQLPNIIHIHGSKDRLLPILFSKCDIIIENGGHLMILDKSDDINRIFEDII